MSLPEFPKNDPPLSREEVINQIISSIAMEELGLSHIINAEGEKIQYALGTITGVTGPEKPLTLEDLLKLNESVHQTLDSSMMNQIFLKDKLKAALSAVVMQGPTGPVGTILDSYDTIDELRKAHPTGSQGDAYLVKGNLYTWDSENQTWKMVGSLTGPQGLQGPAGPISTILDSYPSYQELLEKHPMGDVGDVYIAGDELYTWVADEKRWMSLGSLVGPEGPKGATGPVGVILGNYIDYQELIKAHSSGEQGDAYLVGQGDLYVWKKDATNWEKVGNLRGQDGQPGPRGEIGPQGIPGPEGPEGPQGKAGTSGTIRETFEDVNELEAAHPDGSGVKDGDLFLVGKPGAYDLYFWDGTDWVNAGPFTGAQGQDGPQGPKGADSKILGSYNSYNDLKAARPTGSIGDCYLINGELYTWIDDGSGFDWRSVGNLRGPVGPVGTILGSYGTFEELYADHPKGNQGDAYLVNGTLYVWDPENNKWKETGNLRGPAAESYMIIPFASAEAPLTYSNNGMPSKVSLLGFGYGDRRDAGLLSAADYSIPLDPSNQKFNLSGNGNKQLVFSLPVNVVLKSIHITVGNYGRFTPTGKVIPYVQLYSADPGSNTFSPIPGALAVPLQGIGPGANISADTMLSASVEGLNVKLKAGTRIGIGGLMRIDNDSSSGEKKYWLYFTGGIAMAYDPEG